MKLVAKNLVVLRGGEEVISNLSFTVRSGEALVVTGENGAGKSTLLRAIAGLLPTEQLGGLPPPVLELRDRPADYRELDRAQLCHYLGHENAMKMALTVEENLCFWRDCFGNNRFSPAEALDRVGLAGADRLPFARLSTGQRRRAAICRLLVAHRPLWLLDEPTTGLDAGSEIRFSKLMQTHLDDGGIIVAATHMPLGLIGAAELALSPALGDAA